MTADSAVITALTGLILDTGVVRKTTCSGASLPNAGAVTVSVTSAAGFAPDGVAFFDDTLGEEPLHIASVDYVANTITFDLLGVGYTGLQFTHAANVTIYTNLFGYVPNELGPLLNLGDAVIWVHGQSEDDTLATMSPLAKFIEQFRVQIVYCRLLVQRTPTMPSNIWAYRQQTKARADLETIAQAFKTNRHLARPAGTVGVVTELGRHGQTAPSLTKGFMRLTDKIDVSLFAATMTLEAYSFG